MKFILEERLILHEGELLDLHDLPDYEEDNSEEPETIDSEEDVDWAAKYRAAVNKDAVWEEYLNTVWEDDFSRIKLIKEAFRLECVYYGFDDTNPFITFIKKTYLKSNMSDKCYNAIHNAIVDRSLTTDDLLGKGQLGTYNIIFTPDLYIKDETNIAAYLKKQKLLVNKATPKAYKTKVEFVANTMYNLDKYTTEEELGKLNRMALKLNTFARINELEAKATGSVPATEKSDFSLDDAFIQQIDTLEEAMQIIVYLILKFVTNKDILNAVKQYKEITVLLNQEITYTELYNRTKILEAKFNLENIQENQALKLINKIIKSDKFNFTKA